MRLCLSLLAGSSLITGTGNDTAGVQEPAESMAPVPPPPIAADPSEQKFPGLEVGNLVLQQSAAQNMMDHQIGGCLVR